MRKTVTGKHLLLQAVLQYLKRHLRESYREASAASGSTSIPQAPPARQWTVNRGASAASGSSSIPQAPPARPWTVNRGAPAAPES
eukprot:scaffold14566_cov25-Tisochrysis_lutea.AAC.1